MIVVSRAALAFCVTGFLFSLASPVNSFTIQHPLSATSDYVYGDPSAFPKSRDPQVNLDHATFFGIVKGDTHQFLGIPFAYPP